MQIRLPGGVAVRAIAFATLAGFSGALAACSNSTSTPAQPIRGGGTPTPTPTPTHVASPTPTPTSTASTTPSPPPMSGGSEAACILTIGTTTYAFVPGFLASGALGLSEVTIANGTTIASRGRGFGTLPRTLYVRHKNGLIRTNTAVSPTLALTPPPAECGADATNRNLYIESNGTNYAASPIVNIVNVSTTGTMSLTGSVTTDATTASGWSGGSFDITGIVFDPTDSAFVISASTGYELYSAAGTHPKLTKGLKGSPAENFGYDPNTNLIWSPTYDQAAGSALQAGNITTGTSLSTLTGGPTVSFPDSGAVDSSTEIGIAPEEGPGTLYLVNLNGASLGGSTFTAPNTTFQMSGPLVGSLDYIPSSAIESTSHIAFLAGEFGSTNFCVAQLPTTKGSAAPTVSDYACANFPATPAGVSFDSPFDPHATSTFALGTGHYGLMFNGENTYIAVIDLSKALSAPRDPTDPHAIKTGYDLVANNVVYFIQI